MSVVIPAYNNAGPLDATLDSLTRQTVPADWFDVVVADNASEPPLGPVVDRYADRLRIAYHRSPENRGRSANRNLGAAHARSEILVFLDADTIAHPELLRRHWLFHSGRGFRPGVLIARRFEIDWAAADALRRGEPVREAMVGGYRGDLRDVELAAPHHRRDLGNAPWMYAFTHNVSVDRTSFEKVGGFDEAMLGWGHEDAELFYRVFHLHGGAPELFEFDDLAVSYHLPHFRSWVDLFAEQSDNAAYFYRKHRRYDVEMFMLPGFWGRNVARIGWFRDSIEVCRRAGLARAARLPAPVRDRLRDRRALVSALGATTLTLGPGSRTFDHDAPASDTNDHLIGFRIPYEEGFDAFVSVDLWRFLLPDDLGGFLNSVLARADEVLLVATAAGPDPADLLPLPFVGDLAFVEDILRSQLDLTASVYDGVTVLTIRSPRAG
jgi:glycosyltransferase involved in cell wall biosynthesis